MKRDWPALQSIVVCFIALTAPHAFSNQDLFVTLSGLRPTNNQIQLTLTGEAGVRYVIESTSDLQNFWTPVATNSDPTITRIITILAPTNSTFYRASRDYLPIFGEALVGIEGINLRGNNISTDSFDSAYPLFSTNGQYDSSKAKDNGNVLSNAGITNSLIVGDIRIKGFLRTGPNYTPYIGTNGSVGDAAWVTNGNLGIQPGHFSDDMNVYFPSVNLPLVNFFPALIVNTNINGINYKYYLTSGYWLITNLSDSVYVAGNANVYVPPSGTINMTGNDRIYVAPSDFYFNSLTLYASPATTKLAGNGVINDTGNAIGFFYYGLSSNTNLSLSPNGAIIGTIYCPHAKFVLGAGGIDTYDFVGAVVAKSVTMNGHFSFHFDENLKRILIFR